MIRKYCGVSTLCIFIIAVGIFLLASCINITAKSNYIVPACLSFQVFTPKTENKVVIRTVDSNRIYAVYTPTNRMVYLNKQWEYKQFNAAIQNKSMALDESENGIYRSMHTKETYFEHFNSIPTTKAWSVLKEHILNNDEIWTFDSLDAGFVVIRGNHLYCMVITDHSV